MRDKVLEIFKEIRLKLTSFTFENREEIKKLFENTPAIQKESKTHNRLHWFYKLFNKRKRKSFYKELQQPIFFLIKNNQIKAIFREWNKNFYGLILYEDKLFPNEDDLYELRPGLFEEQTYLLYDYLDWNMGYGTGKKYGIMRAKTASEALKLFKQKYKKSPESARPISDSDLREYKSKLKSDIRQMNFILDTIRDNGK